MLKYSPQFGADLVLLGLVRMVLWAHTGIRRLRLKEAGCDPLYRMIDFPSFGYCVLIETSILLSLIISDTDESVYRLTYKLSLFLEKIYSGKAPKNRHRFGMQQVVRFSSGRRHREELG